MHHEIEVGSLSSDSVEGKLHRLLVAQQAIAFDLAETLPPAALFGRVLSTVCATLGWDFGAAWRLDHGSQGLHCDSVWNQSERPEVGAFGVATLEQRFERGRGLPGYAWATGAPAWIRDVSWDPRMASSRGARSAGLHAGVALPLGGGEAFEGVLEFFSSGSVRPDGETMAWLSAVAAQVALGVTQWRTHEALTGRDRALAAAVNGVVIADARIEGFPITYVNLGFERLTGYSREEVLGRPCSILQGPETNAEAMAGLRHGLSRRAEARATLLNYRKDGSEFWNEVVLSPVFDDAGELVEYIGVQQDVSERHSAEQQVRFLAHHDPLTGLANRALLAKVLQRTVERARRHDKGAALVFVDLDRFKAVNDTHGHCVGDALLAEVAARLGKVGRAGDLLARQGGDEFLVVLGDLDPERAVAEAVAVAARVEAVLAEPFDLVEGAPLLVRGSVGISVLGRDAHDAEALLRHADTAMYRAKRLGAGPKLYRASAVDHRAEMAAGTGRPGARVDPAERSARQQELSRVLQAGAVRSVFQPIVDLESGSAVGYEALARGPQDSLLAMPDALFATARAAGRLGELDWACRAAALEAAAEAGLGAGHKLFVNVEPDALALPCPPRHEAVWHRAAAGTDFGVVLEITERALTARPADLIATVAAVRERGWGIALDDVGADVASLALMPLLRPDVIKLDLRLVQDQPTAEVAEIVNAVRAQRERTGAIVLAEGIETAEHVELARALGATLGQGWFFGRPGPLPEGEAMSPPARPIALLPALAPPVEGTPYAIVAPHAEVRRSTKRLLTAISIHLERQAAALGATGVIVSAFQTDERFTVPTRRRYTALAADAAFVAALGIGMAPEPAPGVRGASLQDDDALRGEWSVAVLGPHFAAALVAIDLGDTGPENDRRFDYALTYNRDMVVAAVNSLTRRVQPL